MAETPPTMEGLPPSLHLVELLVHLLLVLQLATQLRTSGHGGDSGGNHSAYHASSSPAQFSPPMNRARQPSQPNRPAAPYADAVDSSGRKGGGGVRMSENPVAPPGGGGESASSPLAPLWIEAPSSVEGLPSTPHLVKILV